MELTHKIKTVMLIFSTMFCLTNVFAENSNKLNLVLNIDFFDLCYAADNYPSHNLLYRIPDSNDIRSYYPKENFSKVIKKAAENGFKRINFRISVNGGVAMRSKIKEYSGDAVMESRKPHLARTVEKYDPLTFAVEECRKQGLEIFAWVTPFDDMRSDFTKKNPQFRVISKSQDDSIEGLACFGYKETQNYFLSHYEELLDYGVDGLFLSDRTHSNIDGKKRVYGWNQPVIGRYESLYGKLTPAIAKEILSGSGLAFERFSKVQGSFYTEFLSKLKAKCLAKNVKLAVKTSWDSNDKISYRLTSLHKSFFQWEKWINEGIVDELVIGGDGATCWEKAFVLANYDIGTESVNPKYYKEKIPKDNNVHIYRWLTLWSWGWKNPEEIVQGLPAYSTFTGEAVKKMLNKLNGGGLDGVYMHEALNIIISEKWDIYKEYVKTQNN